MLSASLRVASRRTTCQCDSRSFAYSARRERALRSGSRIPGRVRLIVGNAGGRSTGIGTRLQRLCVELVDVNQPVVPRPGTGRTPLRGGGLSGGSAAFGFALGVASAAARGEAQARQRDTT